MPDLTVNFVVTVRTSGDYYADAADLRRYADNWIHGGLEDRDDVTETEVHAVTPAEAQMLDYALGLARDRVLSEDGFTDDDQAAIDSLRRLTAQHATTEE